MKLQNPCTTAVVVVVSGLALSACNQTSQAAPPTEENAAIVEPLSNNPDLSSVRLTEQAAVRLGITTVPVSRHAQSSAVESVIPYGAVMYDPSGGTWTYTEVEPFTYVRAEVVVDRIVRSRAMLRDGPAVGTRVVSVGAAELYGAEVGIDH
ncbi:MAG: hypothetical protein ACR2GB_05890 [Nocardioidaceae bacterium]